MHDKPASLPRIAIIGCGAATRDFFLPALSACDGAADKVILVDPSPTSLAAAVAIVGARRTATDYREVLHEIDAAIVATPHRFHAAPTIDLLQHGKHVLVEKPLGMNYEEARRMVQAATDHQRVLAVNNYRRLFPAYGKVRELLATGELGPLRRVIISDGTKFAWQSVSAFYLRDPQARGVLLDRGAHTLDVLCWWLGGVPEVVSVLVDTMTGVEGLAELRLAFHSVPIDVKFSRFHRLENRYRLECKRGTISGRLFDFAQLTVTQHGQAPRQVKAGTAQPHDYYARQLTYGFLAAVSHSATVPVAAADVAPSLRLIDAAYAAALLRDEPWYRSDPNLAWLRQTTTPDASSAISQKGETRR